MKIILNTPLKKIFLKSFGCFRIFFKGGSENPPKCTFENNSF